MRCGSNLLISPNSVGPVARRLRSCYSIQWWTALGGKTWDMSIKNKEDIKAISVSEGIKKEIEKVDYDNEGYGKSNQHTNSVLHVS